MWSVAKSYMRKGFLIHEEMRKYLTVYEDFATDPFWIFLYIRKIWLSFLSVNNVGVVEKGHLELEHLFQCRQEQGHPEERGHCEQGHFQWVDNYLFTVAGSWDEILGGGGGAGGAEARRSRLCLCTLHQPRNQRQAGRLCFFRKLRLKGVGHEIESNFID